MNPNGVRRFVSLLRQSDRQKIAVRRKSQTQDAARFLQPSFERCVRDIPNVYNAVGVAAGEEPSVSANGKDLLGGEFLKECPVLQHFALWPPLWPLLWHWPAHCDPVVVRERFNVWLRRNRN